jgi:hypothetical protein
LGAARGIATITGVVTEVKGEGNVGTVEGTKSPFAIVTLLVGGLVLAAIVGVKSGAMPPFVAEVVLGIAIPIFFGAFFAAIPRGHAVVPGAGWPPVEGLLRPPVPFAQPAAENDLQHVSEVERVYAWRNERLAALGVAGETAVILGAHPRFSVHELDRLLKAGCPLGTALRILWPA